MKEVIDLETENIIPILSSVGIYLTRILPDAHLISKKSINLHFGFGVKEIFSNDIIDRSLKTWFCNLNYRTKFTYLNLKLLKLK